MARSSEGFLAEDVKLSLTLDRYQELMRLPIAAFNGLNNPNEINEYQCSTIWKQSHRNYLAQFIAQAEEIREKELGYYLGPKCVEDELHDVLYNPLILDKKHLISLGKEVLSEIQLATPLTLSVGGVPNDPVVIVLATTVTDVHEICVTYPDETEEIHPSRISIAGGNVTIQIPRSRLVKPTLNDDRDLRLMYDDDANFLTTVDVYRKYIDPEDGIVYFYYDDSFTQQSHGGYGIINNARLSIVDAYPASWSGGVPSYDSLCSIFNFGCYVWRIKASYKSGIRYTQQLELETCRLTHTLMPYSPCDCAPVQQYWKNDREPLQEGFTTPYGNTVGALEAWMHDSRSHIGFGGIVK